MADRFDLWVYLSASPLLWLTLTLAVWLLVDAIVRGLGRHPAANPVLISIVLVAALLLATGTPYATYFAGAQFIHFLLGPATVALAIPLMRHWKTVRANLLPMVAALVVGSFAAVAFAVGLALAFGLPDGVVASLAPKSVTAGVAMAITAGLGGDPALTAVLVISTGIIGAIIVTPLMNLMGLRDYAARGFAVGLASHGIGTARAFSVDPVAGLFAGIAMGLNAVLTALIVPLILR